MVNKHVAAAITGGIVTIVGILLDAFWKYQYWSNKPAYSLGPILVATAGLTFIAPLGVVILVVSGFNIIRLRNMEELSTSNC